MKVYDKIYGLEMIFALAER
uniref:Uncharacterized protein n=1 Tax=Rhizophora mucronata TaxID=61149 RepID=A0A2P2IX62_RHIMU